MCVCNRLPLLKDWMTNNREALFDMMITDEAHHYPAPTWIGLAEDLKEASPPDHVFNELLLTATPHHHKAGNLDDDTCRDAPALTPYTLLDGLAEASVKVVKDVVFLDFHC